MADEVLAYWKNLLTTRTTTLRERAERAEAENGRLRHALERIADQRHCPTHRMFVRRCQSDALCLSCVAHAALQADDIASTDPTEGVYGSAAFKAITGEEPTTTAEPTPIDLVRVLRVVLGLPSGSLAVTPKAAWDEAIEHVRKLTTGRCHACLEAALSASRTAVDQ